MTLAKNERSEVRSASGISESQVSEVKRTEICWTNYPLCKAHRDIPEAKYPEGHLRRSGIRCYPSPLCRSRPSKVIDSKNKGTG